MQVNSSRQTVETMAAELTFKAPAGYTVCFCNGECARCWVHFTQRLQKREEKGEKGVCRETTPLSVMGKEMQHAPCTGSVAY
jgi:hypothetical protein